MMRRVFDVIESIPLSVSSWIYAILGVTFVRTFIENFIDPRPESIFSTDIQTIAHFTLFYFSIILVVLLITHFFSRKSIVAVSKVSLFAILIIFIPPIIDVLMHGEMGVQLGYYKITMETALHSFLVFIIHGLPHISVGIRVEFIVLALLLFSYVWTYTRSILRAFAATFLFYCVFFIYFTLPSYIDFSGSYAWLQMMHQSLIGYNSIHPAIHFASFERNIHIYFSYVISHVYYILLIPTVLLVFLRWNKHKVLAILKNSRPERVLHYFVMIGLGMGIAHYLELVSVSFDHWTDVSSIGILFFSFYCAWMYAVAQNDIIDLKSDQISNTSRPLVTRDIEKSEMQGAGLVFFLFAVVGGYLVGHYALYMVLVFIALSHIYSMPPLHLKRFVGINSFIISLAALASALAGFYTISSDPKIDAFPLSFAFLIVIMYTLMANVKDIKDYEGDKEVGVYTLLVIFGLKRGKQIISLMIIAALAVIPVITGFTQLWYLLIPFGFGAYYLLNLVPFVERKLFALYFGYIIFAVLAVLFL